MLLYGGAFCGIFTVVCAKCISRTGIRTGKRKPCVNMNTERFAGRAAIVTGGGSGIGAAVAKKLRLPGYSRSAGLLIFVDIYALSPQIPLLRIKFYALRSFPLLPKNGLRPMLWGKHRLSPQKVCGLNNASFL